jgi:hypothetical protein
MATTKGLYEEAQRGSKLVVTAPHVQWLETPEEQQIYSDEAIDFSAKVLRREFKHERPGRFSPSAMGECHRRVVFGYAGAPGRQPDIDNQEMMDHGSWTHLKWQTEGLTLGYIKEAEMWVHEPDLLSGGSMDGLLSDGSLFELKSAAWQIYNRIVSVDMWPKWENLLQVHNYFLLADIDIASVVYENRSSGTFHEFRISRDLKIEQEVIRRLNSYRRYVEEDELPEVLDLCKAKKGTVYRRCPYRDVCLKATTVSQFSLSSQGDRHD